MHSQFLKTTREALKSTNEERAILRARSARQRFPVLEWRRGMESMHRRAIIASRKKAGSFAAGSSVAYEKPADVKLEIDEAYVSESLTTVALESFLHYYLSFPRSLTT